jgi:hypothetical protein
MLREFPLCERQHVGVRIKHEGARTRRALIER